MHNSLYLTAYDVLALFIFEPHICFTCKLNTIFSSSLGVRKRSGVFPVPAPRPIGRCTPVRADHPLSADSTAQASVALSAPTLVGALPKFRFCAFHRGGLGDAALPKLPATNN